MDRKSQQVNFNNSPTSVESQKFQDSELDRVKHPYDYMRELANFSEFDNKEIVTKKETVLLKPPTMPKKSKEKTVRVFAPSEEEIDQKYRPELEGANFTPKQITIVVKIVFRIVSVVADLYERPRAEKVVTLYKRGLSLAQISNVLSVPRNTLHDDLNKKFPEWKPYSSENQIKKILGLKSEGKTLQEIANEVGIGTATVSRRLKSYNEHR